MCQSFFIDCFWIVCYKKFSAIDFYWSMILDVASSAIAIATAFATDATTDGTIILLWYISTW